MGTKYHVDSAGKVFCLGLDAGNQNVVNINFVSIGGARTPLSPLEFAQVVGSKIILYPASSNLVQNYQINVEGGAIVLQAPTTGDGVRIRVAIDATTTDLITSIFQTGLQQHKGNISIEQAGKGLRIKAGANCTNGRATLVAGTVTVSNTAVIANDDIKHSHISDNGGITGIITYTINPGVSFTLNSDSPADVSTVNWTFIEEI